MWKMFSPEFNKEKYKLTLSRYFEILSNKKNPKFKLLKTIPIDHFDNDTIELWKIHNKLIKNFQSSIKKINYSMKYEEHEYNLLDLKIELAKRMLKNCKLCMHECSINRLEGEKKYCGCSMDFPISTFFDHYGEEPELVPSFTVFTNGCNMKCIHCQNWTISQWIENGTYYKFDDIARQIDNAKLRGCKNLNMVGGEPTPYLYHWLEVSKLLNTNVPLIWNSNSYYSYLSSLLLSEWVDVYLLDFKYGNNDCALKISDSPKYWESCTRNHLMAKNHGELIIRILVLPNHLECCFKPIVEWIVKNLGKSVRINIMWQYKPNWRANQIPDINRTLNKEEKEQTLQIAKEFGLDNFII